ncbi:MAG: SDR family oxidoreductase [Flavobacterium sp.]
MKTILITGASSGIGKSIALHLHQKKYTVYGTSRNPENYPNLPFTLLQLDVRNPESIQKCVDIIIEKEGKIDILVNNAGVGITGALEEIPTSEIENQFQTNFFGPIAVIKAVLPNMREQKSGIIINITSIAGYMGLPFRSLYSASKGALQLLTEGLRMELKPFDIEVVNVAPGDFDTAIASRRFHAPANENSPYFITYKKMLDKINCDVNQGKNPEILAQKIEKIIVNKYRKINYKVGGFLEKFSIILKRILPDLVFEKMLYNHYK